MKLLNIFCSNQNLILEICLTHLKIFNIHIIQYAQLFMIRMPLKWHHINKYNKNCRKVDILTSILACLNSSAPQSVWLVHHMSSLLVFVDTLTVVL
jgi:hypothetical protein